MVLPSNTLTLLALDACDTRKDNVYSYNGFNLFVLSLVSSCSPSDILKLSLPDRSILEVSHHDNRKKGSVIKHFGLNTHSMASPTCRQPDICDVKDLLRYSDRLYSISTCHLCNEYSKRSYLGTDRTNPCRTETQVLGNGTSPNMCGECNKTTLCGCCAMRLLNDCASNASWDDLVCCANVVLLSLTQTSEHC